MEGDGVDGGCVGVRGMSTRLRGATLRAGVERLGRIARRMVDRRESAKRGEIMGVAPIMEYETLECL